MKDLELEELFNDPLLNITPEERALFTIPEEMQQVMKQRHKADYVAQAKPCIGFDSYEPLFKKIHRDLQQGKRQLVKVTRTASLERGRYYIVDGQMLLLEQVGELKRNGNGLPDTRTRCIYETGMESDIMLQTLRKNVVANGYAVTLLQEDTTSFQQTDELTDEDRQTGYIYVLRSLSEREDIRSYPNLYKIGVTTQTVEERTARAEEEPTYLMAPIEIISTYRIVNMHAKKLEHLIHSVLQQAKFHVTVTDHQGEEHHPEDWYLVDLSMVDEIIHRIQEGTILGYVYNAQLQCLQQVEVQTERGS